MRATDALRPHVTVVIPVWDEYVAFLEDAVRSVAEQRAMHVRLVIVDNASTTPLPHFPLPVEIVRTAERLSVGAARNIGLDLAESQFILFLDADDVMASGTIALLLSRLRARCIASLARR